MSIIIHRAATRGLTEESWLVSHHSFAFNFWHDPERTGFGTLRVINEDIIAPNSGFGTHGHKDMEIVTIVLEGELTHRDSSGGSGMIRANEVQRMSAGKGVFHSERNESDVPVHLLQIWVTPQERGIAPSYEQRSFRLAKNELVTIVDGTHGRESGNALAMHQQAKFSLGEFDAGQEITYSIGKGRGAYVFIISGKAHLGREELGAGDAAGILDPKFHLKVAMDTKLLIIEVPTSNP